jgi:hypothetical protein
MEADVRNAVNHHVELTDSSRRRVLVIVDGVDGIPGGAGADTEGGSR